MSNLTELTLTAGIPTGGTGNVSTIDALMQTVEVTVTPTVTTANNYGSAYCVGGVLSFTNAFQGKGSGHIQSVRVTNKQVQSGNFTLYLFNANPSSSTFVDAEQCAINISDTNKVIGAVQMASYSQLGTHTISINTGLGMSVALGSGNTTLYGVLVTNLPLSSQFLTTSDVTVGITIQQDGNS